MNLYPWSRAHSHGSMKEKLWKQMVLNCLNREMVSYQHGLLSAVSLYHTFSIMSTQFQMCWSLLNIVPSLVQFYLQHTLFSFVLFHFVSQSSVQDSLCGQIWMRGGKKDCFSVGVGWSEGWFFIQLLYHVDIFVSFCCCCCSFSLFTWTSPSPHHQTRK